MRQVCGLDVHKDSVFVCILNENGIVFQEKYGVLTTELEQMLEVMMQHDVTEVCMESTSVYWMPIWRVLENYIPKLMLVNPYFIKQLPGKKSDVKDAEWIATCLLKDLIKGSYVPEDRIQQLRQYDRRIFDLNKEIAYKLIKLDMALQRCNIRISNYVATTDGKSYQDVVRLISEGKTSPEELAKVIHGRIVNKHGRETIVGALTGVISEKDALKSIDLKTIFLFGGTLSLASALQSTGAGEMIAGKVIGALGENPSPYILTLVVFLLCCIMTNFMSNTATTALMVPICLSIAQGMGADPRAVLMACVIGGSCAYATPIGMPANTMVVGAGGYKFMDYVKSGFPLIIIATVVSMIILPIAFPFFP